MLAYRNGWLDAVTDRMGRAGFVMAIGATVPFLPFALAGPIRRLPGVRQVR